MNSKRSNNSVLAALCLVSMLSYSPQLSAAPGESNSPLSAETQQTKKITGTVSDAMGPIIGASVLVKGSSTGAVTDFDGKFTLNVKPGSTLVISYVGYISQEIKVGSQSVYNISL